MVQINNFTNNDDVRIVDAKGAFQIIEYRRDLSVTPATAMTAFFCNEMNSFSIVVIVSRLISAQHNTTTICRSPAHSAKIFSLVDFQLPWNPRKKQSLSNSGGTVMV